MTFDPALHEQAVERQRKRARLNRRVIGTLVTALMVIAAEMLLKLYGVPAPLRFILAMVGGCFAALVILAGVKGTAVLSEGVVRGLLEPGGRGRSTAVFSQAESLASRGDFEAASRAFEALRAKHGETAALLRAEAEMHMRAGGEPARARDLLHRLRQVTDVSRSDELFATHRLLDLYLGVLADPGRAIVELRRMADRFPDTPDGQGALAELRRRRDHLAQDQTNP
ncbi:hypothetical protein [Gemmatimonas sp.]|uniref:tetratricopeptide repeat protein n=1 Tax=Gemmatimonas sp. TaxID=1962908 RepID=UPI00286B2ABD|nr:hypothetical protein [Gemmatimonas sp.]